MATSIFFNGRVISVPGSYTEVDASGLEQVGVSAVGIVAVIGTAVGGMPVSAMSSPDDFIRITKPEKAREYFKSGDLREVSDMLFAPAKDPDIQAGAQEIVAMKVNPATQSEATLANVYGNALLITSKDYGAFTSQINVSIASGTEQGKLITVTFEDTVESGDNIGGDAMFKVKYTKPTGGWDAMTSEVTASGALKCSGTRAAAGRDSDISTQLSANDSVQVVSSSAGDTTQRVVVYGLDASNAALSETLNLNGTTAVIGTAVFSKILGARVIGTTVGTVSVKTDDGGTTILTIAAGTNPTKGLSAAAAMYVGGAALTTVADAASTAALLLIGYSTAGLVQMEKITLNGTTPVVGTATWSEITFIALGLVAAARTVTNTGTALQTSASTQNTLQKMADYVNARAVAGVGGFSCTLITGLTSLGVENLDVTTGAQGAVSCLSPAEPNYYADLWAVIDWLTNNSSLVEGSKISEAKGGAPSNTTSAIYLAGGSEGTTSFSDWQTALNFLKQTRVNSIVVLTADPAVHAALDAHCAYMCGIGRSERDGFVGLMNTALTDVPTKTEAKTQIQALNTRHLRAFAQAVKRYNIAGELQEFMPPFQAAIAAGMQAGAPVGTSLTFKYANILGLRQSSTWNPLDDGEEMIQAGLCFMENVQGVGRRVVRNVTTHLSSDNIAFTEGSVNAAVNFACFNFRTTLEYAVGKRGFAGTVNATKGLAINILGLMVDAGALVDYRSLNIELVVDVLEVGVEMAPVIPINFVKSIIHLVTTRQTAA